MDDISAKSFKKILILTLFLAISALMLIWFFPWVSTVESVEDNTIVYYNLYTMKSSGVTGIQTLYGQLNLVSITLWAAIIISIISFLGLNIFISKKHGSTGKGMMFTGCVGFIMIAIATYYSIIFLKNISGMNDISLADIAYPLSYGYIPILFMVLSSISSMGYIAFFARFLIDERKPKKKSKKKKKKLPVIKSQEKKATAKEQEPEDELVLNKKEVEEWVPDEKGFEGEASKLPEKLEAEKPEKLEKLETPEPSLDKEEEITVSQKEEVEEKPPEITEPTVKEETSEEPFKSKESEIVKTDTSEPKADESFEKALQTAIDKKQKGIQKSDGEEKPPEETVHVKEPFTPKEEPEKDTFRKKFNVRCPECKNIFTIMKDEGETKIKCPTCGKEGVVK